MTNEEITKDISEIKELLTYIATYGLKDDMPTHIVFRVQDIVDGWKEEDAE